MDIKKTIDELINYGISKQLITIDDYLYVINKIMVILHLKTYNTTFVIQEPSRIIDDILNDIIQFAILQKIIDNTITEKDLLDTQIMDIITPYPHEVVRKFNDLYRISPRAATDYFYKLSIDSNYIRFNRIKNNIEWTSKSKYGDLFITINLSKPEKDPKEIEKLKTIEKNLSIKYPRCLLCKENMGFSGTMFHPSRSNLRLIPITLNNEKFYMQYSPYTYYNEHSIILKEDHIPMQINKDTFVRLLDFLDIFPDYFIGSNADLPIVGGSILVHEHYQAGRLNFPIDNAQIKYSKKIDEVLVEYLYWPLTVLRISSNNKDKVIEMAEKIRIVWSDYQNKDIKIISYTSVPHNTITPIARKLDNKYVINLVLRNNYADEKHPYGLYHPDESLHHIKKENIGLIEVMGLAILPGRLKNELNILHKILNKELSESYLPQIQKHNDWYYSLKGRSYTIQDIQKEVGKKFERVLECCNVFKFGTQEYIFDFIEELK